MKILCRMALWMTAALFVLSSNLYSQVLPLRKPPRTLKTDLLRALEMRKSYKNFIAKKVSLNDLSVIIWSGMGLTKKKNARESVNGFDAKSGATKNVNRRTVPYYYDSDCLDLYVFTSKAGYRYEAGKHILLEVTNGDYRNRTGQIYPNVSYVLVITADLSRFLNYIPRKDRLIYANTTAGAVMQNMALAASALKIGVCPIAGVSQSELVNLLKLGTEETVLYMVPVGYPRE